MKKIILFFAIFVSAVIVGQSLAAESPEPNVTFPIAELGNCGSKTECRAYCNQDEHIDACMDWAERNGLVKKGEAKIAKKVRTSGGPGGCKSEEECRTYCSDEKNFRECISFAKANGMITEEEAQKAEKLQGKQGPGGCRGRECQTYCEKEENHEECFKFAKENGFVHEEQLRRVKEENQNFVQHIQNAPEKVQQCLTQSLGENFAGRISSSDAPPGRHIGEQIKTCFEEFNEERHKQFEEERRRFEEEHKGRITPVGPPVEVEGEREFREERREFKGEENSEFRDIEERRPPPGAGGDSGQDRSFFQRIIRPNQSDSESSNKPEQFRQRMERMERQFRPQERRDEFQNQGEFKRPPEENKVEIIEQDISPVDSRPALEGINSRENFVPPSENNILPSGGEGSSGTIPSSVEPNKESFSPPSGEQTTPSDESGGSLEGEKRSSISPNPPVAQLINALTGLIDNSFRFFFRY